LEEGVFYATLDINGKITGKRSVDSRPSDAIAVGLRMQAPIMIAEKLFDEAGIEDEDDEIPGETSTSLSVKELEDRLQVAVEGEKYEVAAKIRDQIKELKH
jgi:bifunctional DNase/RNase